MKSKKKEIKVRLNDHDFNHLMLLVRQSNLSRESYLRMIINGLVPQPSPSDELVEVIRLLRNIANNMNQIACVANTNGFIDTNSYKQNYEELIIKIDEIMILIRQPTNLEELWQSQKYGLLKMI